MTTAFSTNGPWPELLGAGRSNAPVMALYNDWWQGHNASAPWGLTLQPWCVQIAVWPTTVPPDAANKYAFSPSPTTTDPAASTSATEASGVPVGAAVLAGAAAVGAAADELGAPALLDFAADELLAADVVAAAAGVVVPAAGAGSDEQAAATASTAVPEAASTVRRGRLRGVGVTGSLQGLSVAEDAAGRRWISPESYSLSVAERFE